MSGISVKVTVRTPTGEEVEFTAEPSSHNASSDLARMLRLAEQARTGSGE